MVTYPRESLASIHRPTSLTAVSVGESGSRGGSGGSGVGGTR